VREAERMEQRRAAFGHLARPERHLVQQPADGAERLPPSFPHPPGPTPLPQLTPGIDQRTDGVDHDTREHGAHIMELSEA
jgi:hypothetical protein